MRLVDEYETKTVEEAEALEPGCTGHTVMFATSPEGVKWHCHSRLGIKWREDDLIEYRTKELS